MFELDLDPTVLSSNVRFVVSILSNIATGLEPLISIARLPVVVLNPVGEVNNIFAILAVSVFLISSR